MNIQLYKYSDYIHHVEEDILNSKNTTISRDLFVFYWYNYVDLDVIHCINRLVLYKNENEKLGTCYYIFDKKNSIITIIDIIIYEPRSTNNETNINIKRTDYIFILFIDYVIKIYKTMSDDILIVIVNHNFINNYFSFSALEKRNNCVVMLF